MESQDNDSTEKGSLNNLFPTPGSTGSNCSPCSVVSPPPTLFCLVGAEQGENLMSMDGGEDASIEDIKRQQDEQFGDILSRLQQPPKDRGEWCYMYWKILTAPRASVTASRPDSSVASASGCSRWSVSVRSILTKRPSGPITCTRWLWLSAAKK